MKTTIDRLLIIKNDEKIYYHKPGRLPSPWSIMFPFKFMSYLYWLFYFRHYKRDYNRFKKLYDEYVKTEEGC